MHHAPSHRLRRLPRISLRSLAAATLISSTIALAAPVAVHAASSAQRPQAPCVPSAVDDSEFTPYNTPLVVGPSGVLINDITCGFSAAFGAASSGTFVGCPDGSFTFTPDLDFSGNVGVPYSLAGSEPLVSATLNIFVPGPTCVPSLEDDAYSTPMDTPLAVPLPAVGANDTETCGSPYALVASTTNGALTFNADGTFLYTPGCRVHRSRPVPVHGRPA